MKECNNCRQEQYKKLYKFDYQGELFYGNKRFSLSIYKCLHCGLVSLDFERGAADHEAIHDYWWRQAWLDTYSKFKERIDLNYTEKLRFLEDKVDGRKLLDVGCGCGFFLSVAKREKWDAVGVDISQPAIEYAKNVLGLNVFLSTVPEAHFPDNYFDLITMWDVLEHLDEPFELMSELRRILKLNGFLVIETPNAKSLIHLITHLTYKLSLGWLTYFVKRIYIPSHLFYFSKFTLVDMLLRNGFICDGTKVPFKSLFDDLDIIFNANQSKERWARDNLFKCLVGIEMKISEMMHMPYRLITLARKNE